MKAAVLAFVMMSALAGAESPPSGQMTASAATPHAQATAESQVAAGDSERTVVSETETVSESVSSGRGSILATSRHGQAGLLRTVAADFSAGGTFTIGAHSFFSRTTGVNIPGARDTFAAALIGVEYTPGWLFNDPNGDVGLAFSVSTGASANANTVTSPRTLYSVGDVRFDTRVGTKAGLIDVAADVFLVVPSRVDRVGAEDRSLSPGALLAATLPLERISEDAPGRLHVNVGYQRSNTRAILAGYTGSLASYTIGVSRFDAVPIAVGGEWPFAVGDGRLVPFVEYSREQPIGTSAGAAVPHRVTPGLRYYPFDGLAIDAAVDVGLTKGRTEGVPPVAPYLASLGVSYALMPPKTIVREREKVVEVYRERDDGYVRGVVKSDKTGKPIANAVVTFPPESGAPPTVTNEKGEFVSPPLKPGKHELIASREGFDDGRATVEVEPRKETPADILLAQRPEKERSGTIRGRATDESDRPVPISIEFPNANSLVQKKYYKFDDGSYEIKLPPGRHHMVVHSPGYLSQGYTFEMRDGDRIVRDFLMRRDPGKTELKETEIKLKEKVHFKFNSTEILKKSHLLLDEVASTILKNPQITRVRIEGHTDDIGDLPYNQDLSERRANAVLDYLLSKGVELNRLEAVGYGKTRPLVKNASQAGRAKNRRVEFIILEKRPQAKEQP